MRQMRPSRWNTVVPALHCWCSLISVAVAQSLPTSLPTRLPSFLFSFEAFVPCQPPTWLPLTVVLGRVWLNTFLLPKLYEKKKVRQSFRARGLSYTAHNSYQITD